MRTFQTIALLVAALLLVAVQPASAAGTATILHPGGKPDVYRNVGIRVVHGALYLTTADGKGTLVIARAACSYQGEVLACLPTAVTLIQGGAVKPIDLATGTVYANPTNGTLQLASSSTRLLPRGVLVSLSTRRGTILNLSGVVDKVSK